VSGGKDSIAMLVGLAQLRRFYPKKFELIAVTLDPCFNETNGDYSEISRLCEELCIPYIIKRTELAKIIFQTREEKNPCSLCARMRRGALHDIAKESGCNKIALGHHMDDAAETFMMNLLNLGQIGCFSPVSYLSRKDLYMIRPMIFASEKDVKRAINKNNLPVVKSLCPVDKKTQREDVKILLNNLEKDYPALRKKIVGALQRGEIDRW
ncbi:MAG: tRNA 2-thiocytidine biosynthesis TtcA family protein, partial [Acutalibacteraceae bacterium]